MEKIKKGNRDTDCERMIRLINEKILGIISEQQNILKEIMIINLKITYIENKMYLITGLDFSKKFEKS